MASSLFSIPNDNRVEKFYQTTNNQAVWIQDNKLTNCGLMLLETLQNADQEGLNPEIYSTILQASSQLSTLTFAKKCQTEKQMTFAALHYISAIKGERLNLQKIDKDIAISQLPVNEASRLASLLQEDMSCSWLKKLSPPHTQYQILKTLLATYKIKKNNSHYLQIPPKTHLQKGDNHPIIQIITTLLKEQDIPLEKNSNDSLFDEKLEAAIQFYQRTHGLEPNGKIDSLTVKTLNISLEERIKQIIVTMERYRWLPNVLGDRYILVNIAGFYLQAVEDSKIAFYMPVITGKHYRETPILNTLMTEIIFNPLWHVPHKIAVQDKLPLLQKDAHSLSRKGYHIYDQDGQEICPSEIDWSSLNASYFPYRLRQDPGKFNALGKIRFTLQNSFSIYLHGTPEQTLFHKTNRSLSSGCVRVENPPKLAEFVLKDSEKWPLETVEKIAAGNVTKNIKLSQPLPVYLTYFTVWADEYNHIHFVKDIYGQDQQIWKALQKADRSDIKNISSQLY